MDRNPIVPRDSAVPLPAVALSPTDPTGVNPDAQRLRHCSIRTEDVQVNCVRRFILSHDKRQPIQRAESMARRSRLAATSVASVRANRSAISSGRTGSTPVHRSSRTRRSAGAIVAPDTLARAAALGSKAQDFLDTNDAYSFFEPLADLVVPGPTFTNVNDLRAVLIV